METVRILSLHHTHGVPSHENILFQCQNENLGHTIFSTEDRQIRCSHYYIDTHGVPSHENILFQCKNENLGHTNFLQRTDKSNARITI